MLKYKGKFQGTSGSLKFMQKKNDFFLEIEINDLKNVKQF